jgi:hypothetical protein
MNLTPTTEVALRVSVICDQQPLEVAVTDLNQVDWSTCEPVKEQSFFASQTRNPGWFYSATMKALVPYGSRLQHDHLLVFDADPKATALLTHPLRMHYAEGRRGRSHVPSVLIERDGLSRMLVDISSPTYADEERVIQAHAHSEELARRAGWAYQRLIGPPPAQRVVNLRMLAGHRRRLTETQLDAVLAVKSAAQQPATLVELEQAAGGGPLGRGVVLCLLADGHLSCDLDAALDDRTVLSLSERGRVA